MIDKFLTYLKADFIKKGYNLKSINPEQFINTLIDKGVLKEDAIRDFVLLTEYPERQNKNKSVTAAISELADEMNVSIPTAYNKLRQHAKQK